MATEDPFRGWAERRLWSWTKASVHALCEDDRAGGGSDRQLDESDPTCRRKMSCPTCVAWARHYPGAEIGSGHFLAEENPNAKLAAWLPFPAAQGAVAAARGSGHE